MDIDTELRLLEDEFPKSSKAWVTDTDPALDQRILAIADRTATYLAREYVRRQRKRISKTRGKKLPPPKFPADKSGTSSIFGQFDEARSMEASFDYTTKASMKAPSPRRPDLPPGAEKMLASLKAADQQIWLDQIAAIVKAGDIELATYLLRRYRIVFRGK